MKLNNRFLVKKGDIAITLLVIMTVLLCVSSLAIFLLHQNSVETRIANVNVVSDAYAQEAAFEYYLLGIARNTTKEVFISDNLAKEDDVLKDLFLINFKNNYLTKALLPEEYNSTEYRDYFKASSNYEITIDRANKILNITLKNFESSYEFGFEDDQEVGLIKIKKNIILNILY